MVCRPNRVVLVDCGDPNSGDLQQLITAHHANATDHNIPSAYCALARYSLKRSIEFARYWSPEASPAGSSFAKTVQSPLHWLQSSPTSSLLHRFPHRSAPMRRSPRPRRGPDQNLLECPKTSMRPFPKSTRAPENLNGTVFDYAESENDRIQVPPRSALMRRTACSRCGLPAATRALFAYKVRLCCAAVFRMCFPQITIFFTRQCRPVIQKIHAIK